ncbi:hypothetical protein N0V90_007073 [Kalmusia sp. IMI 367209]|nr:hypothetical protein N0V90_007073 [Kalmusia sp. IMI 367209]
MPTPRPDAQMEVEQYISLSAITEGLQAVGSALELSDGQLHTIIEDVTAEQEKHFESLPWKEWLKEARPLASSSQGKLQIINIATALAFLRESGRQNIPVSFSDFIQVWTLIREALQCAALTWKIMRSADGSHAIPLWSLIEDGRIRELIRLHIWLPDAVRGDLDLSIHMHQSFGQSWILAGEGKDRTFDVTSAHEDNGTHAEYSVGWQANDEEENDKAYKVHSKSSTITNTGKLVRVTPRDAKQYTRNMTYHIAEGIFHQIEVEPDAIYAKILFLDSSRGYNHDAPVLGPMSQRVFTSHRETTNLDAVEISNLIEDLRCWEDLQKTGLGYSDSGEWEEALRLYRTALHICQNNIWLERPRFKHVSLGTLGKMYRMLGRYREACECLEETMLDTPQSWFRVDCAGELAMIYRHMDRLEDSKRAAEEQYHGAKQLNLEKFACRAIGNVGMVNYQLYLLSKDEELLSTAISQLNERIERAQRFGDPVLEAIGYSRLSLCYIAKGDYEKAVQVAQKNYDLTRNQNDATKIGFSKAFLGRALLSAGRRDEALALFNAPDRCSPIIALCNEISSEHRQYIVEMINAGADLRLRDQQDYSALECAVYNGDDATAKIIEHGLRDQIQREGGDVDGQITQFKYEATLRKGYRDIVQDRLRPVLLGAKTGSTLQNLRDTYAASLAEDTNQQNTFDGLKYVRYADFLRSGRLPRSNDGYTQESAMAKGSHQKPFILFFSYRWIAKDPNVQASGLSPDDDANTQYNRMLRAIELFLDLHRDVNREQLCVWIDFACVDQDHERPGVAALPMNLAQCNAMISLVDEKYYERSWCCIEVLMMQTLRKAYGIHMWYEHIIEPGTAKDSLRTGPWDLDINMAEKQVTYESDRAKILFLGRQTRLLG